MRYLAQHALATGVMGLQLRARQPMFDHCAPTRAGLRIIGQPDACSCGRGRIQCAQARIQRLVVGAD